MNDFPKPWQVERLRKIYPKGTVVVLQSMDDPYTKIPPGTKGTVEYVDDAGSIGVAWENGSSLSLIPTEDRFTVESRPTDKDKLDSKGENTQRKTKKPPNKGGDAR